MYVYVIKIYVFQAQLPHSFTLPTYMDMEGEINTCLVITIEIT
jgi:hypothetical protein